MTATSSLTSSDFLPDMPIPSSQPGADSQGASDNSYDQVPYVSFPYPQSCPERAATLATFFGMTPPAVRRCRVLELGCSTGGNLIPLAERFPDSQFVGIDASARQIADGQKIIRSLDLPNIRLEHRNILDIGREFGEFDYIVAHGVYSWVPREVQEHILEICKVNLAPNGVAYVSYNTFPGWHMRGIIRDMMCYRARAFEQPGDRVRHARAIIDFLAQAVPAEDNAYGMLLRDELNLLRDKEDHYLFHEHLELVNEPIYFHQFVEHADAKGLQYLGEADFSVMSPQNFPPAIEKVLQSVATDLIQIEQYMDFVRNRMFRQTLLCHKHVALDRTLSPERLLGMHVASPARPESPIVDVPSKAQVVFRSAHAVTTTTDPIVKAAILHLSELWPQSVPFSELLAIASSRLNPEPVVVDAANVTANARRLAEPLLRCYATGQVEFSVLPAAFSLAVAERPCAPRWARLQAASANRVTNLRHEPVLLTDLQRHMLRHLDGQLDQAGILQQMVALVGQGVLMVREDGQPIADPQHLSAIMEKPVRAGLGQLARLALLMR